MKSPKLFISILITLSFSGYCKEWEEQCRASRSILSATSADTRAVADTTEWLGGREPVLTFSSEKTSAINLNALSGFDANEMYGALTHKYNVPGGGQLRVSARSQPIGNITEFMTPNPSSHDYFQYLDKSQQARLNAMVLSNARTLGGLHYAAAEMTLDDIVCSESTIVDDIYALTLLTFKDVSKKHGAYVKFDNGRLKGVLSSVVLKGNVVWTAWYESGSTWAYVTYVPGDESKSARALLLGG